jgi:tetratricopeptide (TPR) repeat protein
VAADLANLLTTRERYADALPLAERAVRIRRRELPADHPDLAVALMGRAIALNGLERYAEAEAAIREALAIYDRTRPESDPDRNRARWVLGNVFLLSDRPAPAVPLFESALRAMSQSTKGQAELAALKIALAKARWAADIDRAATYHEMEALRDELVRDHPDDPSRASVQTWLADRDPSASTSN